MNANAEQIALNEEDALRAYMYRFLANALRQEPDDVLIASIAALSADASPIGKAIGTLSHLAKTLTPEAIRDEYTTLFIGVGRGEILPFASYYLTGFLNDKPLAKLRADMQKLGIARADGVCEPEDHIASLLDMMAGLIRGDFAAPPASLKEQFDFFNDHLAKWGELVFQDMEKSANASFYAPIGTIGRIFMEVESQAFKMA